MEQLALSEKRICNLFIDRSGLGNSVLHYLEASSVQEAEGPPALTTEHSYHTVRVLLVLIRTLEAHV